jgi:uncharacterized membrane protein HdeD (DUF308 family)
LSTALWMEKAKANAGRVVLLGGFARIFGAFKAGSFGAGALAVLVGAFAILAGFVLVARSGIGVAAIAFLLAFYFFVDGVTRIAIGFQMKPAGGWSMIAIGNAAKRLPTAS